MNRFLTLILVFATFFSNAQVNLAEKIYEKVNDAVVRIYSYSPGNKIQGQGSGVILKSKGWIITNAHVAATGNFLYAEHHGNFIELDSFIVKDIQSDIMVIRIKKIAGTDYLKGIPDITVFDSDKIKTGQRIYTIGSPLDFENTISEGIVSGIRRSGHDSLFKYLQISAPISEGSSGGAVLDAKGRLLGITTSVILGKAVQNINFAIPINKVFEVVEQAAGNNHEPLPFDSCFKKAYEEMEIRHYAHALFYFMQAATFNRGSENDQQLLNYMIGRCFLNLNEPDSAIAYLETAVSTSAKKYCYYYLGKAWMQKKYYENSQKAFRNSISADTNYVDAYNGMVLLYIRQNQLLSAAEWLGKAVEVDKESPSPETMYLTARVFFMSGKYNDAIEILTDLIKWKPNYADAILFLATVYREKGETDKSLILQQRAFEIKPELQYIPGE